MIVSLPTGRTVVVITAVPVVELIVAGVFSPPGPVNVTVPVAPTGSVAVIVTDAPNVLGPDVVTVTVGVTLFTV